MKADHLFFSFVSMPINGKDVSHYFPIESGNRPKGKELVAHKQQPPVKYQCLSAQMGVLDDTEAIS